MEEDVVYDIEDLGSNIGPYQTEGFRDLSFTISSVDHGEACSEIFFHNGESVLLIFIDPDTKLVYRDGYRLLMPFDYYRDGDTVRSRMTNDRILFYLTLIGSE